MNCPKCGRAAPDAYRFCGYCGTQLLSGPIECPHCGSEVKPDSILCGRCGQNLQPGGTKIKGLSKPFYLGLFLGSSLLSIGWFVVLGWFDWEDDFYPMLFIIIGAAVMSVLWICTSIAILVFWYKAWASIQDGFARTTPGKAIGFMLIPFFNMYWQFQLIWGFAKDYNAYVARHQITSWRTNERLFLALAILLIASGFLSWIPYFGYVVGIVIEVVIAMVIDQVCDAVNTMAVYFKARSPQTS